MSVHVDTDQAPTELISDGLSDALFRADPAFWSHVDRRGKDECWRWLGSLDDDGYGRFRRTGAHRFALSLAKGEIPPGLCALHRCHYRACCNPAHLYAGTQKQNAQDRVAAGRMPPIQRRLDADHVRTIRRMAANGVSHAQIARWFGVSPQHIRSIVNRNKWSSVAEG
jgi:hypothetical protein